MLKFEAQQAKLVRPFGNLSACCSEPAKAIFVHAGHVLMLVMLCVQICQIWS